MECAVLNSIFFIIIIIFFSVGRFFYTDQYQSSMRWEGNAIQAPQDADLSLSLQVTPSSPKQVNTPTHNYVKVCLNREYLYPADN